MIDEVNARAELYVKKHIEKVNREPKIPDILLNSNTDYRDNLIRNNHCETPYLDVKSGMAPFDGAGFVQEFRDAKRTELETRRNEMSEFEFTSASFRIIGNTVRLEMRLKNEDENNRVYQVRNLQFSGNRGSVDLATLIPPGMRLLWNPYANKNYSAFDPDIDALMICGDITSLEGAFIAFHELKHAQDSFADRNKTEEYGRIMNRFYTSKDKPVLPIDIQFFLEFERNAHAFALRQMKQLIDNKPILKALRDNIHSYPMQVNTNMLVSAGIIK